MGFAKDRFMSFLKVSFFATTLFGSVLGLAQSTSGNPVTCAVVLDSQAPQASASQPKLRFSAEIRRGPQKEKEVWLTDTQTAGAQAQKVGVVVTVKAGTHLFHWGHEDMDRLEQEKGLTQANIDDRIANNTNRWEAQGEGFYLSMSPLDSSMYGPRGKALTLKKNLYLVQTGPTPRNISDEWSKSIKSLGLQGWSNAGHTAWINVIDAESFRPGTHKITQEEVLPYILQRAHELPPGNGPPEISVLSDIFVFDQMFPGKFTLESWPENFLPAFKSFALGKAFTPQDVQLTINAMMMTSVQFTTLFTTFPKSPANGSTLFHKTILSKLINDMMTSTNPAYNIPFIEDQPSAPSPQAVPAAP